MGTVDLAQDGLTPYEILQYYYGDDINLVFNAPTEENLPSYPGIPLRLGSAGEDVRIIKRQLNRIARNYPAIKPHLELTDFYDVNTEQAVKNFQKIFNLTPDGIVGKSTWYKIKSIFTGVKGLSELETEGLTLEEVTRVYSKALQIGDTGPQVKLLQYYLAILAYFDDNLSLPPVNGVFDEKTTRTVRQFQTQQGITVDGIVGRETWNAMIKAYDRTIHSIPSDQLQISNEIYPGRFLAEGQTGPEVKTLQEFLVKAANNSSSIPTVSITGNYDRATADAIRAVQAMEGLPQNGVTGPLTWDAVVSLAKGNT